MNQAKVLVNLLYLGQGLFWISVYSFLICVNALVTPVLHFSPRVQNNTFFLVLFDSFMDTVFGAVLPVCMVAHVAVTYLTTELDMTPNDANEEFVQAFLVGKGLVPANLSELLSLAWPYVSLWIKLGDLKDARRLWSHKEVIDHRRRGPRWAGASGPKSFLVLFIKFRDMPSSRRTGSVFLWSSPCSNARICLHVPFPAGALCRCWRGYEPQLLKCMHKPDTSFNCEPTWAL